MNKRTSTKTPPILNLANDKGLRHKWIAFLNNNISETKLKNSSCAKFPNAKQYFLKLKADLKHFNEIQPNRTQQKLSDFLKTWNAHDNRLPMFKKVGIEQLSKKLDSYASLLKSDPKSYSGSRNNPNSIQDAKLKLMQQASSFNSKTHVEQALLESLLIDLEIYIAIDPTKNFDAKKFLKNWLQNGPAPINIHKVRCIEKHLIDDNSYDRTKDNCSLATFQLLTRQQGCYQEVAKQMTKNNIQLNTDFEAAAKNPQRILEQLNSLGMEKIKGLEQALGQNIDDNKKTIIERMQAFLRKLWKQHKEENTSLIKPLAAILSKLRKYANDPSSRNGETNQLFVSFRNERDLDTKIEKAEKLAAKLQTKSPKTIVPGLEKIIKILKERAKEEKTAHIRNTKIQP